MSSTISDTITTRGDLRSSYAEPSERAVRKVLTHLDQHMRDFIALSPLLIIGSSSDDGADVAPRGDRPGFVQVLDDTTLLIPDWPGNNRLDTLTNVLARPQVGLMFLIPGVDEPLRVNGVAEISVDPALLQRWDVNGRHPKSVMRVTVHEAFMHCGKAFIRSRLWHDDHKVDRSVLPSYAQMIKDQAQVADSVESLAQSIGDGYRNRLY